MNRQLRDDSPPPRQAEEDPFRYGWRYVRRQLPDGREVVDQVPLSWEDVLYPEEDDFVVQPPPHLRDFEYCHGALETYYADQLGVVVLGDCRVDWGVAGLRPLGPDVLVLFDVREWRQEGTFRIAEEGGRPVLVLEIASPSTREHDVRSKPDLYYRAGVERYVIVDRGPAGEDAAQLRGWQRGQHGWVPLPPDAQGRLDLAPVALLLGITDDHPWLYDAATGERLPDRTELTEALAEAEKRVREQEKARARAEKKAAKDAQARVQAETKAHEAEKKARKAAKARVAAQKKAREAAQAQAALEQRLRELEEQLRRQQEGS